MSLQAVAMPPKLCKSGCRSHLTGVGRWIEAESIAATLKIASLSSVRHLPSETDLARFQMTTCLCSWGSSAPAYPVGERGAYHAGHVLWRFRSCQSVRGSTSRSP